MYTLDHNMEERARRELTNEYIKKIKIYSFILKIGAFIRFDIKDDQIVSISRFWQLYSFLAMITAAFTGYIIILQTSIKNNYLILPEYITLIELVVLNNLVLLNIHVFNRHSGAKIIKQFIEIDLFLGVAETKVMRDIVTKDILILSSGITSFQLLIAAVLSSGFYNKIPVYIYFVAVLYFQLLFTLCYDHVVHVCLYKFLCLRVHYLNVGLVKIANLYNEYLIERLISYPYRWKKEYDDDVDLSRKDTKYFTESLRMVDAQVRRMQHCYRFTIFAAMTSLVIGTFLAVQAVIVFIKDKDIPVVRTFSLVGWFFVSWSIFFGITQQTDKLNMQIQRTKLICTYIQLKPNNSVLQPTVPTTRATCTMQDEVFSLSRSILDTLAVSDCRISIYDLFYFNQRLLRSIATSVFVYITMQLQIAFPKRNSPNKGDI